MLERLLVKGHIANIGLPKHDLIFFNDFFLFKKENVFLSQRKKNYSEKNVIWAKCVIHVVCSNRKLVLIYVCSSAKFLSPK